MMAIPRLRSLYSSRDWNEYWDYHQKCELERNHLSRYDKLEPICKYWLFRRIRGIIPETSGVSFRKHPGKYSGNTWG